jgi:nitroreductase
MESFPDLLRRRRSIRTFRDRPVEEEKVHALVDAALYSPSAKDLKPWHFIVVREEQMLHSLARCKEHGAGFLAGAPLALVVAADTRRASAWVEDASIASVIIQLAAEELGLGSCWIQIRERITADGGWASDYIRQLLAIPEGIEVEAVIAVGYPGEELPPHGEEELMRSQVHYGRFGGTA